MRLFLCGLAVGLGLAGGALWWQGRHVPAEIRRLERTIDSAKAIAKPLADTIRIYVPVVAKAKAESDRLAGLMTTLGPTTLEIRTTPDATPRILEVDPAILARFLADSLTIATQAAQLTRYAAKDVADSIVIATQATEIQKLKGPRCGLRCGLGLGVIGTIAATMVLRTLAR